MDPFEIAAAIKKVPVSIRSGKILYSPPFNIFTPSILISFVPAPFILAPIKLRKLEMSTISGSQAAFLIIVLPLALVAAIRIEIVAPTLTLLINISVPISFFLIYAVNFFFFISIFIPILFNPSI